MHAPLMMQKKRKENSTAMRAHTLWTGQTVYNAPLVENYTVMAPQAQRAHQEPAPSNIGTDTSGSELRYMDQTAREQRSAFERQERRLEELQQTIAEMRGEQSHNRTRSGDPQQPHTQRPRENRNADTRHQPVERGYSSDDSESGHSEFLNPIDDQNRGGGMIAELRIVQRAAKEVRVENYQINPDHSNRQKEIVGTSWWVA